MQIEGETGGEGDQAPGDGDQLGHQEDQLGQQEADQHHPHLPLVDPAVHALLWRYMIVFFLPLNKPGGCLVVLGGLCQG